MFKTIKILLLFIFCLSLFFYLQAPVLALDKDPKTGLTKPVLQINIPTVSFSTKGKWIGEYIKGIYEYSVAVVGILAALVLMFAGLLWLTAGGNASKVDEAKKWIMAAISGLVLMLASYTLLFIIIRV